MNTLYFLSLMLPGTFVLGVYDVYIKKILKQGINESFLLGLTFVASSAILFAAIFFTGFPEIKPDFWGAFWVTGIMNIFSNILWYKAFKREEASLISPIRLLTPPFVLLSGFIVLREVPSFLGVLGVLTTFIGFWVLLKSEAHFENLGVNAVIRRPGIFMAVLGALSFSISFPFDKRAVINSSGLFFAAAVYLLIGAGNLIIGIIFRDKNRNLLSDFNLIKKDFPFFVIVHTLGGYLTFQALNYALAAYAASIKRLWSLWAVVLSGQILKEDNIGKKFIATAIMLFGIVVTLVWG